MPEVNIVFEHIPAGHPALKKNGKLKKRAKAVLNYRDFNSHYVEGMDTDPYSPVRNTELFYAIADEIQFFPEAYDQEVWGTKLDKDEDAVSPCGTAFCIAGHAVHKTGWVPANGDWFRIRRQGSVSSRSGYSTFNIGKVELGLTGHEANCLFDEDWHPSPDFSVPEALKALGDGAYLGDVTYGYKRENYEAYESEEDRGPIEVTGKKPDYYNSKA